MSDPIPAALREALDAPFDYGPGGEPIWDRPTPQLQADRARTMAAALRWALSEHSQTGSNWRHFAYDAIAGLAALEREATP